MGTLCSSVTLSRGGAVSMLVDLPEDAEPGRTPVVVLAHGSGNGASSPFLETFATGLAERGIAVVRFNFPYKERTGMRPPDPMPVLADTMHDVLLAQAKRTASPPGPLFVGGKSMGARVAARLAAELRVKATGLVFLGFPLHKPGDASNLRADDLPEVKRPMLFVHGTRDPFGSVDLIRSVRKERRLAGSLHVVDGGDHSFALPKSKAAAQAAAFGGACDAIAAFVAASSGGKPDGAPRGRRA